MEEKHNNKVLFVEIDDTERYPPEISVLNALSESSLYDLVVCSLCPSEYIKKFCNENEIGLIDAGGEVLRKNKYDGVRAIKKIHDFSAAKDKLWSKIDSVYEDGDIIWVNTFAALKLLGERLLNYKYVVHLLELVHVTRMFYKLPYPKYDFGRILRGAYRVIECEYNRACITQTWFALKNRPVVIPNKLYLRKDNNEPKVHGEIQNTLNKLQDKKIILYQGILGPERPIGVFAEAVAELGSDYAMVVMSGSKLERKYRFENTYEIGFVRPPDHLYITKMAYIGILSYQSSQTGYSGNDSLNSIYCAPNKIYEYSKFGLPMIGNDIPGLKYTIDYSGAGICVSDMTKKSIKEAILRIDTHYSAYRKKSEEFYDSIDIKEIIETKILSEEQYERLHEQSKGMDT